MLYLYSSSTPAWATFETVLHNMPNDAPVKFVDVGDFAERGYGQLVPQRPLRLVDLTTDGLHRLKVPKDEPIACLSRNYSDTARWAEVIHH